MIALYVVAKTRAERGILVKLAGRVVPNPVTGRLTVVFENDPQLLFRMVPCSTFAMASGAADHPRDVWDLHHTGGIDAVLRTGRRAERHGDVPDHIGL